MKNVKKLIKDVKDFPKKGIIFKDITPVLLSHKAMQTVINEFVFQLKNMGVTKVVSMESRGFLFGVAVAMKLKAGFVPVRKPGKLPRKTAKQTYKLEYGTDSLEIHRDAIKKGDKVVIIDDVLATGGTANAVVKLVEKLGGKVVGLSFLMELEFLRGRDKLSKYKVNAHIKY